MFSIDFITPNNSLIATRQTEDVPRFGESIVFEESFEGSGTFQVVGVLRAFRSNRDGAHEKVFVTLEKAE